MELLILSSTAVGVIIGLSSERRSGFGRSVLGGLAIGGAGLIADRVFHQASTARAFEWGALGIIAGSTVSVLSPRRVMAQTAAPAAVQAPVVLPTIPTSSEPQTMWIPVQPVSGGYQFAANIHYRATASVDLKYPKAQIQQYLMPSGWSNVMIYDSSSSGDTLPTDWPAENLGTLEVNRRWVRVDATRSGGALSMPSVPGFLFVTISIRIANVWQAA